MKWWDQMPWSSFFWMLSFKPAFSFTSFTFIKRLFNSSLLSVIRVGIICISEVIDISGTGQFSSKSQRRAKECSNYHKIALISHASRVMLKILQARLQQYVNWELPDVQARFRKGRGTRDQSAKIIEKAREFQKNICFIHYAKTFDCVDCGKFLKRWEY